MVILAVCLDGRYLSAEDSEFVQLVTSDVADYLNSTNSDKNRVLVFPPVLSYYRFLIHKTVEDFLTLHSFSIGEGDERRTVIALNDILLDNSSQPMETSDRVVADLKADARPCSKTKARSKPEKSRKPDQAVYVPRAKRSAFSEQTPTPPNCTKTDESVHSSKKSTKEKRPVEIYVPRPLRTDEAKLQNKDLTRVDPNYRLKLDQSDDLVSRDNQSRLKSHGDTTKKEDTSVGTEETRHKICSETVNSLSSASRLILSRLEKDFVPPDNQNSSDPIVAENCADTRDQNLHAVVTQNSGNSCLDSTGQTLATTTNQVDGNHDAMCTEDPLEDKYAENLSEFHMDVSETEGSVVSESCSTCATSDVFSSVQDTSEDSLGHCGNESILQKKTISNDNDVGFYGCDIQPKISITTSNASHPILSDGFVVLVENSRENNEIFVESKSVISEDVNLVSTENKSDNQNTVVDSQLNCSEVQPVISTVDVLESHPIDSKQPLVSKDNTSNIEVTTMESDEIVLQGQPIPSTKNAFNSGEKLTKSTSSERVCETDNCMNDIIEGKKRVSEVENEASEMEGDSWDALFDENGDAFDPKLMDELTKKVGSVSVQKPSFNYLNYQPKEPVITDDEYGHLIEIYDFPAELKTPDLLSAFKQYMSSGFDIKWVDDTHAIGIFSGRIAAVSALTGFDHPLMKVRSVSQASRQTKSKAKRCTEFLLPYKERPVMVAHVARNMIAGALGLRTNVPKEKRDEERRKVKEAKDRKRADIQSKKDAWDGVI